MNIDKMLGMLGNEELCHGSSLSLELVTRFLEYVFLLVNVKLALLQAQLSANRVVNEVAQSSLYEFLQHLFV